MNAAARKKSRKPRRRSALVDVLNGVLSLIVIAMLIGGGMVLFGIQRFHAPGPLPEDTTFLVEPGSGLSIVAQRLDAAGLIADRWTFEAAGRAMRRAGDLQAGEFEIAAAASMADILNEITEGRPIVYAVTIPEGFTSWQVVERLRADVHLTGEIDAHPPEGSVLPMTYDYRRGDTRESVLARMQADMQTTLAGIWENRDPDLPIATPEELVILASIVEKETGVASERPEVAGVFVNRMRIGMRLQSDPTIIYGITNGEGGLGRGLRRSEIDQPTAYNTYQIDGLPPTPIANPGIEALRAVASPAEHDYLYFVADGTGGHAFATNYNDHLVNVARWREIEREMAAAEAAAAAASEDGEDDGEVELTPEAEAALDELAAQEAAAHEGEAAGE